MKQESQTQTEEHPLRNTAAAVTGAAQGLKEGLQEEHLIEETKRAIHNVGELTRAAATETRQQWESPEMRRLRRDTAQTADAATGRVRDATAEATARAGGQAHEVAQRTRDAAHRVQERTMETAHRAQDRIQHGVEEVRETTTHLVEEGRTRARAVGETTRRAKRAPGHLKDDLKEASSAYTQSLTSGLGMFAGAAVLGTAALVVLTVGMVVWLNGVFGSPAGYFVTVLLYAAVAGVLAAVAKASRKNHREEAREHVRDARREISHVTRPVRRAFTTTDNR